MSEKFDPSEEIALNYWARNGEKSYAEIVDRVVGYLFKGSPSVTQDTMREFLLSKTFMPNSPVFMNSGTELRSLAACFVLPVEDSMESIFDCARNMAMVMKEGGGVGLSLSKLRPENSSVKSTKGVSSGPISFLEVYDSVVHAVRSGGTRRGAALANLRVDHPDILKFIKCKEQEGKISNFNISVAITNEFMHALKNKSLFQLAHEKSPSPQTVDPQIIWKAIINGMWRNGEPGVQFIDTVNKTGPYTEKYRQFNVGIETSNPCLHGDTRLFSVDGLRRISELSRARYVHAPLNRVWKTGIKSCVRVSLLSGTELVCTPDHQLKLASGEYCAAADCLGQELAINMTKLTWGGTTPQQYRERDFALLGFIFGDGTYHKASGRVKYVYLGAKDGDVENYLLASNDASWFDFAHKRGTAVPIKAGYCDDLFTDCLPERILPDFIFELPENQLAEFLRGLFSANGYVIDDGKHNRRVCLKSVCRALVHQVQQLLTLYGIQSTITREPGTRIAFANGEYDTKESHTLKIFDLENITKFHRHVGFLQQYKSDKLSQLLARAPSVRPYKYGLVTDITDVGEAEVFDFTSSEESSGWANGIRAHNCSESFLRPFESCVLGSINLYNFVTPFWAKDGPSFNKTQYEDAIRMAVEFLNAIVDMSEAPLPEINKTTRESRKIGIGVLGLADALSAMGLPYNSDAGRKFTDHVLTILNDTAIAESERQKYNNAMLTLVAPTGTTGLVANVSQGIEPHFRVLFNRNSQKAGQFKMMCRSFNDFYHSQQHSDEETKAVMEAIEKNGGKLPKEFALKAKDNTPISMSTLWPTADEISPLDHIKMLEIVQKNVHNGVSKTINLPNSATEQDIEDVVFYAWEAGIKGMTVYRDGSRNEQVISEIKSDKKEPAKASAEPKDEEKRDRPVVTHGTSTKVKIGCGNLYITTNRDEHGPCEVFTNLGRAGGCPSQSEATARLISLCLRSGVPVEEVTDQLVGIRCMSTVASQKTGKMPDGKRILSCPDAIGKCLKIFNKPAAPVQVPIAQEPVEVPLCPKCEVPLQREGRCGVCPACGYSKCG